MSRKHVGSFAVVGALAAGASGAVQTEFHSAAYVVDDAAYDQHYAGVLELPRFDTLGGTRELVSVEYLLDFNHEYIWNFNANPNDFNVYSFTTLRYDYQTTLNGAQFFPTPDHPGVPDIPVEVGTTWFSQVGPFAEPFGFPFGGIYGTFEAVTDAGYLAAMTGSGTMSILAEMNTYAPVIRDYDTYVQADPSWTDPAPDAVFSADTTTWDLTKVGMSLRVYYNYVPGPGTVLMVGGGLVAASRRRR